MIKFCYIAVLLICKMSFAQLINFTDANFKAKLLSADLALNIIAYTGAYPNYSYAIIDTNSDGEIQFTEAEAITSLSLFSANISNLAGIEHFVNLVEFGCGVNNLTTIDISQLTHLIGFGCWQNNLTSLNVSNLPNLKYLYCFNNQINSIDFSNNPQLTEVFCNNNLLTNLDFSSNPLFNQLDCYNNPNLTSVNIKNGATQLLGTQTYYNQCWVGLPNLTNVCVDGSEINAVANYLNGCGLDINAIDITKECALGVNESGLFSNNLKIIKNNNELSFLSIQQEISSIKIYDLTGKLLFEKASLSGLSAAVVLNIAPQLLLVQVGFNDGSSVNEKVRF